MRYELLQREKERKDECKAERERERGRHQWVPVGALGAGLQFGAAKLGLGKGGRGEGEWCLGSTLHKGGGCGGSSRAVVASSETGTARATAIGIWATLVGGRTGGGRMWR